MPHPNSRYDAFGEKTSKTGTTENKYLFAGEQFDEGLGDYYLRQRYYDTSSGRFTRRDTHEGRLSAPLTLHKYLYANNNPSNYTDPSGLFASTAESNAAFTVFAILATIKFVGITTGSYNPERLGGFAEEARPRTVLDAIFAWKNTWSAPPLGGFGEGGQPSISNHTGQSEDIDDLIAFIFPYDTRDLRKNMANDGRAVPSGYEAHHIVPGGYKRAEYARAILSDKGIDINDALNGARLHGESGNMDSHRGRGLHSKRAIEEIVRRLEPLEEDEAREELRKIGQEMEKGTFKF